MAKKRTTAKKTVKRSAKTPTKKRAPAKRGSKKTEEHAPAVAKGKPSALIDTRIVHCGDCLEQLRTLPDGCVDLIYIDPPFNSNRNYEVFWGETKEKRAFDDRHASTAAYIDYMRPRCVELARVLKRTGSFYYHCDWHASHYVKVMLDQILGENNFRSDIVWRRTNAKGLAFKGFPNNHDNIFYYTGPDTFTWNRPFKEYDPDYIKQFYRYIEDETGRRYRLSDLTNPNPNRPNLTYEWNGHKRVWRWTKDRMQEAHDKGIIYYSSTGLASQKRYLDEMKGMPVDTVWEDILPVQAQASERLGYPTQKPLALLDRIIKASSNPNDIVLDAFCGCGTALVAAQNLGRQWIGVDVSPTACRVMAKRLRDVCKMREDDMLWQVGRGFIVRGLPWTIEKLKAIPHFEFENWAVIALGGIPNKVQVGDMGIDGRIFPVGSKPADTDSMFAEDWFPVQVKQSEKVGRPEIDKFEAVMEREGSGGRQRGFFVAFSYTKNAEQECAAFHKRTGRIIKLLTVQEILDEEHVQKM
ncbi:MAG: restriction endonuclease [Phycisphaerales bacterium]|nr:restriction endonuclease [Phycisphaerales bacterium]